MTQTSRDRGGPWSAADHRRIDLSWLAPLVAVAMAGITIIAVIGMWVSARLTQRSVEAGQADSQQERLALAVALDDYDRIAELSDWVATVRADLGAATAERVRWTSVLDSVSATMPEGVGLIRFDGRADTADVSVTVESTSYTALGDWLGRTSTTAGLMDLTLVSAQRRATSGTGIAVVEAIARGRLGTASASPRSAADDREPAR